MTTPINCERKVCSGIGEDFDKTTFTVAVARTLEAKPDEHIVIWQAGTYCTITSCKAFALKVKANEDYITLWQNWLKTQIDENVPVRNIVRHPFSPTENIPTVEWLKNDDNFHLLRSYLLLDEDTLNDKPVTQEAIMKYIYGLYHFATIRVCFFEDLCGLPYNLNREMKLLDIYYDWELDDRFKARIPIADYDLTDIEHQQWKRNILLNYTPNELPQLITLKIN